QTPGGEPKRRPPGYDKIMAEAAGGKAPASPVLPEPALSLPTDGQTGEAVTAAREHFDAGQWEDALPVLQAILDKVEDVFITVPTVKGQPERRVSARAEIQRLLGTLPPKGKQY